jgi:hypothetical protein
MIFNAVFDIPGAEYRNIPLQKERWVSIGNSGFVLEYSPLERGGAIGIGQEGVCII